MSNPPRKLAFVLAPSEQGCLIVNRLDVCRDPAMVFGVGHWILETGAHEPGEVDMALQVLELRRQYFGDGVVGVDCGANIGVHTIPWARRMTGWGRVIAIEAQELIYYALAGNIVLNNCFNARAIHAAVSDQTGEMRLPALDPRVEASFGSLELKPLAAPQFIGQQVDYEGERTALVRRMRIDEMGLERLDFLKIDVEGMELEALAGARETILAHRPVILAEFFKIGTGPLGAALRDLGYEVFPSGINLLAIHPSDPIMAHAPKAEG